MVRKLKTLSNAFAPMSMLILALSAMMAFSDHLSLGIGKVFPVLDPSLEIAGIRPIVISGGPGSLISGTAFKKQGDCSYIHGSLKWYLGNPDGLHVRIPLARFRDKPVLRGKGWTEWTGIIVGLDPWQVQSSSFSTVAHRCPWWPWPITSTFYISNSTNGKIP